MKRNRSILLTAFLLSLFILHSPRIALAQPCVPDALLQTIPDPVPADHDFFGESVAIDGSLAVIGAFGDQINDPGRAYVLDPMTGATVATLNNPAPGTNNIFAFAVAISGNLVVAGAPYADAGGKSRAGTAYIFNALTGALTATLNNPAPDVDDYFGWTVAIHGNLAVVGADLDNPGGVEDAGTAFVFNATTGALVATLNNPVPEEEDRFGESVGISGNLAVVGAMWDEPGGVEKAGTAYVFNATTGALVATLNNPGPDISDRFGSSVAISGDRVVVGGEFAGTAYTFNATTGALVATLNDPTPTLGDLFGRAVAISGNLVVSGAPQYDGGGFFNGGTAHIFDATTGAHLGTLNHPTPGVDDLFGRSVAVAGSTIIVGAIRYGTSTSKLGSAYTFTCAQCTPDTLEQTIPNPVPGADESFGWSVGIDGNVAVVGAFLDDPGGLQDAGSAYVFDATTGALLRTLSDPFPAVTDFFGWAVAISGNLAVVGAHQDNPGGISDAGTAFVFDATTGALVSTLLNPAPASGDTFGFSVAISGNVAAVGGYIDATGGVLSGRAYTFNATTGAMMAALDNPAPNQFDFFGYSIGISGNVAVVGAYRDNPGGVSHAGTAYMFDATTGAPAAWQFNNPTPAVEDRFGWAVAISGNVAVVGAPYDDDGGTTNTGAAYLFNTLSGALLHTLHNPIPAQNDEFGYSVSIFGNRAMVGAYGANPSGFGNAGSAYIFDATTGLLLATLNNPAPATSDQFGASVAISGSTAIAGANLDDPGGVSAAGSAYTFTCAGPTPTPTPSPTPTQPPTPSPTPTTTPTPTGTPTPTATSLQCAPDTFLYPGLEDFAGFGGSVASSGNLVVVGATGDDPGGVNGAGTAYVFDMTTNALVATLNNPAATVDDAFGRSVAISGNLAVVGAPKEDPGGVNDAGTAYVFNATNGALVATLNNPSPVGLSIGDIFGWSVAISGDVAVVGAPQDASEAGTAYVFNATTGALTATLNNPAPEFPDIFGWSVAVSGNVAVIGARWDSPGGVTKAGTAYVFNATTGALTMTLNNPDPTADDEFGGSVAVSGNLALVGSPWDDPGGVDAVGTAYLFNTTTGAVAATLNNPSPAASESFGSSVALSGNVAVVGASADDPGGVGNAGTAYVFDAVTGTLTATLNNPTPVLLDLFGFSVGVSDNVVVVGAPGEATDTGIAYAFTCWVLDALVVSHSIPPQIAASDVVPVDITMHNDGNTTWTAAEGFSLAVIRDDCGLVPFNRIGLPPSAAIPPGGNVTFSFFLKAPAALGACAIEFRMVREFVAFFGETLSLNPDIVAVVNNAVPVSNTVPQNLAPAQSVMVGFTFQNTGNTWWLPEETALNAAGRGLKDPRDRTSLPGVDSLAVMHDPCGLLSVPELELFSSDAIGPNKRIQFLGYITAPITPGLCELSLRMRNGDSGDFGTTLTLTVNVAVPANQARDWENYE